MKSTNGLTPVGPGNTLSLKHGADSPRVIAVMAGIVRDEVVDLAPWVTKPIFEDALWLYCRAEGRARLINDYIFKVADEQGVHRIPIRLFEAAVACDGAASRAADRLGLTPLSRAKLSQITTNTEATAAGLQSLEEQGRLIREKREAEFRQAESKADDDEA